MYLPNHFQETNHAKLIELIGSHPFAALVTYSSDNGLDANHIPFEFAPPSVTYPHGLLRAHIARANPLWQNTAPESKVLVIFKTTDHYISPNWYPSKHESHQQVPTWNYQVVHIHGSITFQDDEKTVRGIVARLTREHERRSHPAKPWKLTDSKPEFIGDMLSKIIGLEIKIDSIIGKSKLSQNKLATDRLGVVDALQNTDPNMAQAILATL